MNKLREWWNEFEMMNFLILVLFLFGLTVIHPIWQLAGLALIAVLSTICSLVGLPLWLSVAISIAIACLIILCHSIYAALWIHSKEEGDFIAYI